MDTQSLRADCGNCAALCCVAFAFDRAQGYPEDKPNGTPCRHLGAGHQCTVYNNRSEMGYASCGRYDCFGAGQRVCQEIFGGESWQDHPARLPAMVSAFIAMARVHELLVLLGEAGKLPLSDAEREKAQSLHNQLEPDGGWSEASLEAFLRGNLEKETRTFLKGLQAHLT